MDIKILPVIPLRGAVAFPSAHITFDVGRAISKHAMEAALDGDKTVFISAQKNVEKETIAANDIYTIGTISKIEQVIKLPGGITRLVVRGINRAKLLNILQAEPFLTGEIVDAQTNEIENTESEALLRLLQNEYKKLFSAEQRIDAETYMRNMAVTNPEKLCYCIAAQLPFEIGVKQQILEENDLKSKVIFLLESMRTETEIMQLEQEIGKKVKNSMDKNQREYYLREQMKAISDELGTGEDINAEAENYRKQIKSLKAKKETKDKLLRDVDRFMKMNAGSSDGAVMRTYLDTVLELPWNKKTKENNDINNVRTVLDEDHYGLKKVKERILEYMAVKTLTKGTGQILCLYGPPGTGKTSVAKSVARALNRNFMRISLGGIHDETDIRGHRKTYIGAMPGRIIDAVTRSGSKNALILLDEIDKMGMDYKGDPSAALLEVLDAEQNNAFRDHYIEVPFDLSEIMFIATANTLDTLSAPLLDRLEIIELSGYTTDDKLAIAEKYLMPRAMENTGMKNISVDKDAMRDIIEYYTRESGVRKLERCLTSICRKAAMEYLTENKQEFRIERSDLKKYLGVRKYSFDMMNDCDEVGLARGLAWTAVGGDTLNIEVNVMNGTGKTELTGQLGDVMKESATAAISFIRSISTELNLESDFYKNKDIHIHVPEGAVPKDGPSAGITIATAVASALTKRPVKRDIAMTGEITLRGSVLPIGGLKEKSLAAYRAGIKTVIIPKENEKDLEEIDSKVRSDMKFIAVQNMNEVLKLALI